MTEDSFSRDLSIDYDSPLTGRYVGSDGHAHWPLLFSALPLGFRPLTIELSAPASGGPHPLVVYIHGGGWAWGYPTMLTSGLTQMRIEGQLLDAGFAVAKINYRLSGEGRFPMQLHDCKAAVRYLRRHSTILWLDPDRIGVMGESAGGHLAAMVGLTGDHPELEGDVGVTGPSSKVSAVVAWYPATDFLTMDAQRPSHAPPRDRDNNPETWLLGGAANKIPDKARAASPISYVSETAAPMLLHHGSMDRVVPIGQSRELLAALQAAGADATLIEVVGADHCFWGADTTRIMPAVIAFLDSKL